MAKKPYQLPPGVRFLSDTEIAERAARTAAQRTTRQVERVGDQATGAGWQLPTIRLPRRRRRRRFMPPASIWRKP